MKHIITFGSLLIGISLLGLSYFLKSEDLFPRLLIAIVASFGLIFCGVASLEANRKKLMIEQRKRIFVLGLFLVVPSGGAIIGEVWLDKSTYSWIVFLILILAGLSLLLSSLFGGSKYIQELNAKIR